MRTTIDDQVVELMRTGLQLTSQEISERLSIEYCSAQPATNRLLNRNLLHDTGLRRPSKYNKPCKVWGYGPGPSAGNPQGELDL